MPERRDCGCRFDVSASPAAALQIRPRHNEKKRHNKSRKSQLQRNDALRLETEAVGERVKDTLRREADSVLSLAGERRWQMFTVSPAHLSDASSDLLVSKLATRIRHVKRNCSFMVVSQVKGLVHLPRYPGDEGSYVITGPSILYCIDKCL